MPLTLLAWIQLCLWVEVNLLSFEKEFTPVPPTLKKSYEFYLLLVLIGFLTEAELKDESLDFLQRARRNMGSG